MGDDPWIVQWCVGKMALGSNYVFINTHLIESIHFKPYSIFIHWTTQYATITHQPETATIRTYKRAHNHRHLKLGCYMLQINFPLFTIDEIPKRHSYFHHFAICHVAFRSSFYKVAFWRFFSFLPSSFYVVSLIQLVRPLIQLVRPFAVFHLLFHYSVYQ